MAIAIVFAFSVPMVATAEESDTEAGAEGEGEGEGEGEDGAEPAEVVLTGGGTDDVVLSNTGGGGKKAKKKVKKGKCADGSDCDCRKAVRVALKEARDGFKKAKKKAKKAAGEQQEAAIRAAVEKAETALRAELHKGEEERAEEKVKRALAGRRSEFHLEWILEGMFAGTELTDHVLAELDCAQLGMLKIMPRARHGYVPEDMEVRRKLLAQEWYKPNPAVDDAALPSRMTSADQLNELRINKALTAKECE